jgi:hypothetical protein
MQVKIFFMILRVSCSLAYELAIKKTNAKLKKKGNLIRLVFLHPSRILIFFKK